MSSPYETGNAEASSSALFLDPLAGRLPLQPLASHSHPDAGEHDFTEEQVDEYREQDRFLPVRSLFGVDAGARVLGTGRRTSVELTSLVAALASSQIANVARIMRESLPPSAKIAKESKECLQECVSEFISFIVSPTSTLSSGPVEQTASRHRRSCLSTRH